MAINKLTFEDNSKLIDVESTLKMLLTNEYSGTTNIQNLIQINKIYEIMSRVVAKQKSQLEQYFKQFRDNIVGIDLEFESPYGKQKIIYTDWTASGRLYRPIEEKILNDFGPYVANTHTETTETGTAMTLAYHKAKDIIKKHINCNEDDVLIMSGTGMTGVVNKFQRILGLKIPENLEKYTNIPDEIRPVVFITHMEHHSNQTSWLETIAKVEVIPPCPKGLFCMDNLKKLLEKYTDIKNYQI